jgi:hypothetical protein
MALTELLRVTRTPSSPSCSSPGSSRQILRPAVSELLLVVLLLVMPATLPALAYASPPDPSWIYGIYDDADHDDVAVLVMSTAGSLGPAAVSMDLLHTPLLLGTLPESTERAPVTLSAFAVRPRAPPPSRPPYPASSPVI